MNAIAHRGLAACSVLTLVLAAACGGDDDAAPADETTVVDADVEADAADADHEADDQVAEADAPDAGDDTDEAAAAPADDPLCARFETIVERADDLDDDDLAGLMRLFVSVGELAGETDDADLGDAFEFFAEFGEALAEFEEALAEFDGDGAEADLEGFEELGIFALLMEYGDEIDQHGQVLEAWAIEQCGMDPDEFDTGEETAVGTADMAECIDPDVVEDIAGAHVVDVSFSAGAQILGDMLDGSVWALSRSGCTYELSTGDDVTIAEVSGEVDHETISGGAAFGRLAEEEAGRGVPDVGDEAFWDRGDELVVRVGDELTLTVEVAFADLDDADVPLLEELARDLADVGADGMCDALPLLVPDDWGATGGVLRGSGGGAVGGDEYSYETCRVDIAAVDGASVATSYSEGRERFDILAGSSFGPAQVETVDDIGDEAYRFDGDLYFRIGDDAFVVSSSSGDDELVEQVARGVAASLN